MNAFRIKNRHGDNSKKNGSIDGFVTRSGSLNQFATKKTNDGFTGQSSGTPTDQNTVFHSSRSLEAALRTHGNIPTSDISKNSISRSKKPRSLKRVFKALFMTTSFVMVAGLVFGGFLFGKAWLAQHKIFQGGGNSSILFSKEVKPEQLNGEGDGRVNVLLSGIGGGDHPGADLTDSLLVASIDPVGKSVTLISVPRDLWVRVPDFWSMKINAAYSSAKALALENGSDEKAAEQAGFSTLEATVEQTLGIAIHYHALVNFQAFKEGVDAVGGISVNVKEDLYDPMIAWEVNKDPYDYLIAAKGQQNFDGMRALQYARSRYTSSDFARGERQREVIIALKDKILQSGTFTNPKTISKLIDALGNNVSINATLGEMMRMYDITKDIPASSIVSQSFAEEPNLLVATADINEQSVVVPRIGTNDYSEIQAYVRNTIRDPYLQLENASITVLNGTTTAGLAGKTTTELKSYGYNVTATDAAPTSDYQKTVIYMKPDSTAKFTKNYLEKRFGVSVTAPPAGSTVPIMTDFVIVVGTHEVTNAPADPNI